MPLRRRAPRAAANHRMEAADTVSADAFSTTRRRPSSLFGVPRLCARTKSPCDDIGGCAPAALKNVVDKIRNRRRRYDAEPSTNEKGFQLVVYFTLRKRLHRQHKQVMHASLIPKEICHQRRTGDQWAK